MEGKKLFLQIEGCPKGAEDRFSITEDEKRKPCNL